MGLISNLGSRSLHFNSEAALFVPNNTMVNRSNTCGVAQATIMVTVADLPIDQTAALRSGGVVLETAACDDDAVRSGAR